MKKLLLATTLLLATATAAQAEINVDIGLGQPAYSGLCPAAPGDR